MAKDISKACKFNEYVNVILLIMFMAVLVVLFIQDSISFEQSNHQSPVVPQKEIHQEQVFSQPDSMAVNQ